MPRLLLQQPSLHKLIPYDVMIYFYTAQESSQDTKAHRYSNRYNIACRYIAGRFHGHSFVGWDNPHVQFWEKKAFGSGLFSKVSTATGTRVTRYVFLNHIYRARNERAPGSQRYGIAGYRDMTRREEGSS